MLPATDPRPTVRALARVRRRLFGSRPARRGQFQGVERENLSLFASAALFVTARVGSGTNEPFQGVECENLSLCHFSLTSCVTGRFVFKKASLGSASSAIVTPH